MKREKLFDLLGWIGIGLIQGATLPSIFGVLTGISKTLPPLSMVLLIWAGLALFMFRSIDRRNTVAIASNGVGWLIQSVMLAILVLQ